MTAVVRGLSSALIASAGGGRARIVCGFDLAAPGATALGPAVTVRVHPGDNLAVHIAVARATAGSVIVVDAGGEQNVAFAGDLVVRAAARKGIAGIVIDGAIRDRAEIAAMGFPLFHRGTSPRGAAKHFAGEIQVPIELGGAPVSPGDLVCADDDGLAVVRAADSASVLVEAHALDAREAARRARVEAGESTLSIFGLENPALGASAGPADA